MRKTSTRNTWEFLEEIALGFYANREMGRITGQERGATASAEGGLEKNIKLEFNSNAGRRITVPMQTTSGEFSDYMRWLAGEVRSYGIPASAGNGAVVVGSRERPCGICTGKYALLQILKYAARAAGRKQVSEESVDKANGGVLKGYDSLNDSRLFWFGRELGFSPKQVLAGIRSYAAAKAEQKPPGKRSILM